MKKKRIKKFYKNLVGASFFGLSTVFGWLIVQGALAVLPEITGITLIIIGVLGLAVIGYLGFKQFK